MVDVTRQQAANRCLAALDTAFMSALCEPARCEILRRLILNGRSDIGAIASGMPQDRSVVSRHLQVLERAGVVSGAKVGRATYYEIEGPAVLAKLEALADAFRTLIPSCCPGSAMAAAAPHDTQTRS
ncbi:MAG: winged helix-turn-helix transcriptional regulator [Oceanicaulis sp.]|nr:winged helix-turn-helix transcriptional regulator [Oceanicaulis sp.]